ncbi:MAG: chromosome segregation protein SMC [Chitinophagaceae bacterium]
MKLKTLEIKGFKSFPDKTIIHFDQHITGIVGPNGCGKSNIVDAIRWVIGEQKISALRSENLESLIFNGSKTRNVSNIAEVNITFENTKYMLPVEFNTITITRRFYRSGESEFRLNDVVCRLKDIQNLFLDTGISSDSYAIIALGDTDEIIKNNNSRRIMIEKAAGISIYKDRKKEADRKLDSTLTDLNRIEDLLFEINNQLKTLENQSKKANKYIELKKEYKELSIESAKILLAKFNEDFQKAELEYTFLSDNFLKIKSDISTKEADLEKSRVVQIEKEQFLQEAQKIWNAQLQELARLQSVKQLLEQKKSYLVERQNTLTQFIKHALQQIQELETTLKEVQQTFEIEQQALHSFQSHKHNVDREFEQKNHDIAKDRNELNAIRIEQQKSQQNRYEIEKKLVLADASISNLKTLILKTKKEIAERILKITDKQQEQELLVQKLQSNDQEIIQQNLFQDSLKSTISQEQETLEKYRFSLAEKNRILDAKKNEYNLLKSMIDSMEGYSESLKYLHKNTEWKKAPLLSDVLFVQEKYRTCIEQLFENYLNYYVVDTKADAMHAIQLLKQGKKGKANFFILDQIPTIDIHIDNTENTIAALQVVEYDEKYKYLANHLLKNVFISEQENSQQVEKGQVLLHISGELLEGYFVINGGSVGAFEGKRIGVVKNIEKLLEGIKKVESKVQEIEHRIQQKKAEIDLQNQQLNQLDIQFLNKQKVEFQSQEKSIAHWIQQLQQQKIDSEDQIHKWNLQIEDILSQHTTQKIELQELKKREQQLFENLHLAEMAFTINEQQYKITQQKKSDIYVAYERLKSKVQSIEQELQHKKDNLSDLQNRFQESTQQIAEIEENIKNNFSDSEQNEQQIYQLLQLKNEDEIKINELDKIFQDLKNHLKEQEQHLRFLYKTREEQEQQLNICKDKLNDLKLEVTSSKERLHIEFKINWETIAQGEHNTALSLEELKGQIEKIKKRIEHIGEVNTMAVEAYEEMKNRYDFIVEQRDDLLNARESLLQTINEISTTTTVRFQETFTQIRDNFQRVFKALFTDEDTADLILEHPEDVTSTGIDIVAKPKGKKPSSITQLSGGEKTLTAVALLFAIYLVKPAPFCIMDEVDAPLDDLNVGKFTNMIREFSKDSQFIIVTHNKMSMSALDVIYGVTMQENGVSKLVPVDFRNLD